MLFRSDAARTVFVKVGMKGEESAEASRDKREKKP